MPVTPRHNSSHREYEKQIMDLVRSARLLKVLCSMHTNRSRMAARLFPMCRLLGTHAGTCNPTTALTVLCIYLCSVASKLRLELTVCMQLASVLVSNLGMFVRLVSAR